MDNFDNASASSQRKYQKMFTIAAVLLIYHVLSPLIIDDYIGEGVTSRKVFFPVFSFLGDKDINIFPKVYSLLPLIIGAAILIINFNSRISLKAKAKTFMVFGIVLLLLLSEYNYGIALPVEYHLSGYFFIEVFIYQLIAMMFIFATGVMILDNKINIYTYIIGSIGAALCLNSLFNPNYGESPIEITLKMFSPVHPEYKGTIITIGILQLIDIALLITASVYCCLLWLKSFRNRATGRKILFFWWLSQLSYGFIFIYLIMAELLETQNSLAVLNWILRPAYDAAFLYGTIFLGAYSLLDLLTLVNIPSRSSLKTQAHSLKEVRPQSEIHPQLKQNDIEAQMLKLKCLLDKKLITVEEYNRKKSEFLDRFN